MESNSHPIYDQEDMNFTLAAIKKYKKEAEQSHQLLWAVIHEAGGEIVLPHRLWIEIDAGETREIIMWDDRDGMHLKVKRLNDVGDDRDEKSQRLGG